MQFQTGRFARLGDSPIMIMLSPLMRPAAFWGQIFRYASLCFLLGLAVPWHLPNLARGWPLLIALILPMTVLLAWDHGPAASLAFQYISELLVILFLAALSGSCRTRPIRRTMRAESAANPDAPEPLRRWRPR
jgi:hypothetical protein